LQLFAMNGHEVAPEQSQVNRDKTFNCLNLAHRDVH